MELFDNKPDPMKQHEEALNQLRENRRMEEINKTINKYNAEHDAQIEIFQLPPEKLTFDQFKSSHVFPYRFANKLKSIYNNFEQANLLNRISTADINKLSPHYNNYNVKKNQKEFSLRTYSNVRHSLIGDIFFDSDIAFLLLININTRYAYAYQLTEVKLTKITNRDEYQNVFFLRYATKDQKTTESLIKAFDKHLANHKVNILRFDGEKAINSKEFQKYLEQNHIIFIPAKPKSHTSLALIDRLCRTIRDI